MKLHRVARLRPAELADRLRQEQFKLLERWRLVDYKALEPPALDVDGFRERARACFFAGAVHDATPALISERMPHARDALLKAASRSLAGRFDLLGYRNLDFREPVDWHFDPISGTRAPLAHWSRIDPLDRASVGDHKVVWELNRHQWLLHWAEAYAFTRDESYAERSVRALDGWLHANPPGVGLNWASSLELAMRLVSWCWALVLLRESPIWGPALFALTVGPIHAHAAHIARYLSTTFSPNTHLLGEALGLLYAGVLFPGSVAAERWLATARSIFVDQAERQILPDGVCFEQSTCYQRYTAEMYMHFLILAERGGLEVPCAVSRRVRSSIDFLMAIRRTDGSVAQIGDSDGGWLLPLLPRKADDMRGVFSIAAALFDRRDCAEAAGGPTLEAAWLLGPRSAQGATPLPAAPAASASRLFEHGGYAVLRSGFEPNAHQMIFDVGPLGCPISGAHGHADLLALTCDIFGEPCIVDPGMPSYGGNPAWRDAFRSTALHSSIVVDECSQATTNGPFSWKRRPRARLRSWLTCQDYDFVDGEHDAYRFAGSVLTHRRRIVFVKPRYWLVVDDLDELSGRAEHRIELCFQFAPRHVVRSEPPWSRVVTPSGHALLVRVETHAPLRATIHEGEQSPLPIRGWFSPAYGSVQPAPALVYRTKARLPLRLITLLLPVERANAPLPEAFPPRSDAALLQRICC